MLTDLQTRKLVKFFSMYDADYKGHINCSDFENIAKKLAKRRNWSLRSPRYITLSNQFTYDWKCLKRDADKGHDKQVSLEEWLTYYDGVLGDPDAYQKSAQQLMDLVFDAFDDDDDGKICAEEWGEFLSVFNVSPVYAPLVFPGLDADNSGFLCKDEVKAAFHEFFYSNDVNSPANQMFGPF
ncbi:MAG: calcium-binding protein [Cyanobacteria bacterium P01_E01_bin.6]